MNINYINLYRTFVTNGYLAAGFTAEDVAASGGVEKLRSRLHDFAALMLMEEGGVYQSLQEARQQLAREMEEVGKGHVETS